MSSTEPTGARAPSSTTAKSGLWQRIKGAIIRTEKEYAFLKGLTVLSFFGTLVGAYFQDLSAYQNKVSAQAKEDMTAATDTFKQTANTLSTAITLQSLLFYDFFHGVNLNVGDDKNALTSKNAQDLYKPYEDAAAALHENINLLARQVEINLDWASDINRDPATNTSFGTDLISTSYLGAVNFDCDEDTPKFARDDHTIVKTKGGKSLTIDWYSAKHHVLTIAYCFDVTHKTYMETVRQWASQSSLSKDQITAFFSADKDKKLQAQLDTAVVRVNDFMSRGMNEIEGIRVRYRPTGFYCSLPGVSQAIGLFSKSNNPCTPVRLRV